MEEQQYSIVQQMLKAAYQSTEELKTETQGVSKVSDLKSHPRFNPAEDVNALEKALTAKDIDEGVVIDILTKRTNVQRQEIKAAYQKQTGKSLEETVKKALGGKLESVILDMLKPPAQLDASELQAATKGFGTNEDTLIEILVTRSNAQIQKIKEAYKAEYKTDLEKDIIDDTSGDFQKALLALAKGTRSEDFYVDEAVADKDARALFEAGENTKNVDVSVFIKILTQRSFNHINAVCRQYAKLSKHDLNKTLDLGLKGDIESCMVAIVKVAISRPGYFAEKLNLAMKGWGIRDKITNRIMVTRHEIDMKNIKAQFKQLTGKSLREAFMEETSGNYQTVLVALSGYDE